MAGQRLTGKVALVTGGARGMGAAIAALFASQGARVAIGDILEQEGATVAQKISSVGGTALFIPLDVAQEEQWRRAVSVVVAAFGKLDILVNNAGIGQQLSIEDTSVELWDEVMAVNARGVFLGIKHAAPELRKAGGGSIVNMSSMAGLVGGSTSAPYHASKGAVRLLTKHAAVQYARDGIRVNSVHPGVIETPMTAEFLANPVNRAGRENRIPLGRIGAPQDVAYGALYLASDESSFVTGAELVIDGGRTAQ